MSPRVALVHDWLTGLRGGERVLEVFASLWPDAPIHTLLHVPGTVGPILGSRTVRTSFVQRLPAVETAYRWYLPLFPWAIEQFDLGDFELVVSSSHCVAKSAIPHPDALHLCYCHTPMRYAWDQFRHYFSPERQGRARYLAIRALIAWLRRWDRATADRVDAFAANSGWVADRIRRYYGRTATVIPPPVDVERFTPDGRPPDDHYLIVSALSPYKRLEVAIEAFDRIDRPLLVVGSGPEEERLGKLAGPGVELLGRVDDDRLIELVRRCRGLILPGIEDAGIVPLEAMACGRPALVLARGGASEVVIPDETGVLIPECSPDAVVAAVDRAERLTFNSERIRAHSEGFATSEFSRRFQDFVARELQARRRR